MSTTYATSEFYTTTYGGSIIPEAELAKSLIRGQAAVERATGFKAQPYYDLLPPSSQYQLGMATCLMADYDYQFGEIATVTQSFGGYSIGDVSVSPSQSKSAPVLDFGVTAEAYDHLVCTGLMYRGTR